MKPYAATLLTPGVLELFERATAMVEALPDDWSWLRCHEVARAVGNILSLPVVDGYCGLAEHSWLSIDTTESHPWILDVYAVGRLPPVQLVDTFFGTLHVLSGTRKGLYKAGGLDLVAGGRPVDLNKVARIEAAMRMRTAP